MEVLFCFTVSAQDLKKENQPPKLIDKLQKQISHPSADTIVLNREVKFVVVDSIHLPFDAIKQLATAFKKNNIPFYVPPDWIILNYQFIKKANNPGMTDEQMDGLKEPLVPYIEYLKRLQKQQSEKEPKKE